MDAADETRERLGNLMQQYARLCGRTNLEVAQAVLSSKTLKAQGYQHSRRGHLTERQAEAAVLLLDHWIGVKTSEH